MTESEREMAITGRCFCGAVKFSIDAKPILARTCWCRDCQYLGAGSGTSNAIFPSAAVKIAGELVDYVSLADSGNRMHRRFCGRCGTPMFSGGEARSDIVGVRAGALDDPEIAKPQSTIWTSSAPSWACFAADLPKFERQPPPAR